MSWLHYTGFNGLNVVTDRVTESSGTATYNAGTPGDSFASRSIIVSLGDRMLIPWWRAGVQAEPGTGLWMHFRLYLGANDTSNDQIRIGCSRGGTEIITFSLEDSTALPTLRVAGSVVATAATGAVVPNTWRGNRYLIEVSGLIAGETVSVYADGDSTSAAIVTYTITAGAASVLAGIGAPNEWYIEMDGGTNSFQVTDLGAMDPNDAIGATDPEVFKTFTVRGAVFTADSTPQDWAGTVVDIDELPFSDVDFIRTEAVDAQAAFNRDKLGTVTENVYAIKTNLGVKLSGTAAGTVIAVQADDGSTAEVSVAAPADDVVTIYHQAPPSGGTFDVDKADATALSLFSRT